MFDATTVQSTRTFLPFSIPASSATLTSSRLICSSVSNFTALMFAARGRGKNNYQVFVVIHLLQG